ncbi:MAG: recombination protein NinB [Hyphomicrobiales bacterium]|nr:MAG: recombination protein NinB [Hyphomicrobiales bacterium]
MSKRIFRLVHAEARRRAVAAVHEAQEGDVVTIAEPTRNADQNARMWAMLGDVSKQVDWYGKRLTPEDWKHIFSASIRKLEVVPNLDGTGFVALGMSTSSMSKREMSDLIELMFAFGAERDLAWTDPQGVPA